MSHILCCFAAEESFETPLTNSPGNNSALGIAHVNKLLFLASHLRKATRFGSSCSALYPLLSICCCMEIRNVITTQSAIHFLQPDRPKYALGALKPSKNENLRKMFTSSLFSAFLDIKSVHRDARRIAVNSCTSLVFYLAGE